MKKSLTFLMLLTALLTTLNATDLNDFINKKNCDQIIDKQAFTICYDYTAKGARYVAYTLDGKLVNAVNVKKRSSFYTEKNLPKKYRSHTRDYTNSGYDRGHLANDASFDYDEKAVRKTYTMANIIPQAPKVNRKTWIKAEKLERQVAVSLGSVSVLNGVVYSSNPKRIGKNKIAVPNGFWKMIYNDAKGYQKCFYYQNNDAIDVKADKLKSHQVECSILINK
ncbi:DNA/RNA non-specific endonuclease [Sulfurovum sp.]|uniref:DNA/RNA non-specific endonuclease n=1 Tax=Sulfurovum sp. TaxID=1969726 RepID=UPI003563F334